MNELNRKTGQRRYIEGLPKAAARRIIDATVKRAAKKLDKEFPGWARKVKLSDLEFDSSCRCVFGQLDTAYEELHRGPGAMKGTPSTFILHGPGGRTPAKLSRWGRAEVWGYTVPDAAINAAGLSPNIWTEGAEDDLWAYQENAWRNAIRERARYDLPERVAA